MRYVDRNTGAQFPARLAAPRSADATQPAQPPATERGEGSPSSSELEPVRGPTEVYSPSADADGSWAELDLTNALLTPRAHTNEMLTKLESAFERQRTCVGRGCSDRPNTM